MRGKAFTTVMTIGLALMLLLGAFSSISPSANIEDDNEISSIGQNDAKYIPHAPIRINTNADFDAAHGVLNWATGDGSQGNPWIIEGWDLNGTGYGYCIYVGNTTDYFEIKDCYLHEASGVNFGPYFPDSGLDLYNVQNGSLYDNTISSNVGDGVYLYFDSNYNNISSNIISGNDRGIIMYLASNYNMVSDNTIYNNNLGIFFYNSYYNKARRNNVSNNLDDGIYLSYADGSTVINNKILSNLDDGLIISNTKNCTIEGNNVSENVNSVGIYIISNSNFNIIKNNIVVNNLDAIYMSLSDWNTITNNNINFNGDDGISLISADYNVIAKNSFIQNVGDGIYISAGVGNRFNHNNIINNGIQARDFAANIWDDGYPSGGNYWSDYTGVDLNSTITQDVPPPDLIGDTPKVIDANSRDYYPLMRPTIDGRVQRFPIRIDLNADFDAEHGVVNWATGDGSAGNPWIIEGWDINGTGYGYCIYIGNTTDYFVIANCSLHDADGVTNLPYYWNTGLIIYNANNGRVKDTWSHSNAYEGIYMELANNFVIENNTLDGSGMYGISMDQCFDNLILNNTVNSPDSIYLVWNSDFNTISNNEVSNGITLDRTSYNQVDNNTISSGGIAAGGFLLAHWNSHTIDTTNTIGGKPIYYWKNRVGGVVPTDAGQVILANCQFVTVYNLTITNCLTGIALGFSSNNLIINNTLISNAYYGITISSSSGFNQIYFNNIINCPDQAIDGIGTNQWDNGYPAGGNYWDDYSGVDLNHGPSQSLPGSDGIGDTPNFISGMMGAMDRYPLMSPFEYTEFDVPLLEGWNLISLPVRQLNWSIDSVLESIAGKWDCIQAYDETTSTWKSNNIFRPASVNDLNELNHLEAYWINIIEPGVILTVKGDKFNSTLSLPLKAGWNLVGYPSLTLKSISDALVGTGYDRPVEGFNATAPYRISQLADTYLMKPGEGYWVHVPADTVWIVDW